MAQTISMSTAAQCFLLMLDSMVLAECKTQKGSVLGARRLKASQVWLHACSTAMIRLTADGEHADAHGS